MSTTETTIEFLIWLFNVTMTKSIIYLFLLRCIYGCYVNKTHLVISSSFFHIFICLPIFLVVCSSGTKKLSKTRYPIISDINLKIIGHFRNALCGSQASIRNYGQTLIDFLLNVSKPYSVKKPFIFDTFRCRAEVYCVII